MKQHIATDLPPHDELRKKSNWSFLAYNFLECLRSVSRYETSHELPHKTEAHQYEFSGNSQALQSQVARFVVNKLARSTGQAGTAGIGASTAAS
jgi:hypothetical protein